MPDRDGSQNGSEINPPIHKFIDFVDFVEERFHSDPGVAGRLMEMQHWSKSPFTGFEDDACKYASVSIKNPNSYEVWCGGSPSITTLIFEYSEKEGKNRVSIVREQETDPDQPIEHSNIVRGFCDVKKVRFSESGDSIIFSTPDKEFKLSIEDGSISSGPLNSFS
jgi:hypothetical protein